MNVDTRVQRELDMVDGVRPWTKEFAEMMVKSRWGSGAWVRTRRRKDGWGYWKVVGNGLSVLGRGRTWEAAFKKATANEERVQRVTRLKRGKSPMPYAQRGFIRVTAPTTKEAEAVLERLLNL